MSASSGIPGGSGVPVSRRYELDWLRTLVVLGIIPYHALIIFGASSAVYIKSAQSNPALGLIGGFVLTWGIPTLFLMAGAASRLALEHRSSGSYVRERLSKLLVPMVLAALIFAPLQAYFILLSNPSLVSMSPVPIQHPDQLRGFGEFYRTYLTLLVTTVRGYSPSIGTLALAHVWFIPRLLVVSLLVLALVLLARHAGKRARNLAAWLNRHPALLLVGGGLATALMVALLRPGWLERATAHWPFTDVWSEFALDFALFLCGYLVYASVRLRTAVCDLRVVTLAMGLLCCGADAGVTLAGKAPAASFAPGALAYTAAWALAAWMLSLTWLGSAMRYLTFSTPWQRYLTFAAFPVYLLHMPILTVSAYYLLKLPLPWFIQFMLILAVTLLGAFGVFDLVIRRTLVTRFLFGVKGHGQHEDHGHKKYQPAAPSPPTPLEQAGPTQPDAPEKGGQDVTHPLASARGLHLPGSGGAFRSAICACAQVHAHPYPVRIGRLVDCAEWGRPARQRARDTHYLPGLAASSSRSHERWARSSQLPA